MKLSLLGLFALKALALEASDTKADRKLNGRARIKDAVHRDSKTKPQPKFALAQVEAEPEVEPETEPEVDAEFWNYFSEAVTSLSSFTDSPSTTPSVSPSKAPSAAPSESPSDSPSDGPSLTPSSSPSKAPSDSPTIKASTGPTASPSDAPSASPSESPSKAPSVSPSKAPSGSPTITASIGPTTSPSDAPSASPSESPSDAPSASPSESPSASPSDEPSGSPSFSPSESPSDGPSTSPSESPSASPSDEPSGSPSTSPSTSPSVSPSDHPSTSPSQSPSAVCNISTDLNCTAVIDGTHTDCANIEEEQQPICSCSECVRTVTFVYTGKACNSIQDANGRCTDNGPSPFIAGYKVADALNAAEILKTGIVQQGDEISVDVGAACMPDTLAVTIALPSGGITQTFTIDTSCNGSRGLILTSDYGAFESTGYSCSEDDTHNCMQTVAYEVQVCNEGNEDEQIYDWSFMTKEAGSNEGTSVNLLDSVADVTLDPSECFENILLFNVNRCFDASYSAEISVNATNPTTGLPIGCSESQEIQYDWTDLEPIPPTPSPTPVPSAAPSDFPSSICVINLNITGCPEFPPFIANECEGRPQVMEFRYLGGDCDQSNHFQPRQKFNCADLNGGPPPRSATGTMNYIVATPSGGSDVYFEGPVAVGEKFIMNEDKRFDKLSADMTVQIFESQGGTLLQSTDVHMSCSQPLYLYDIFGSSQVVEWIETDGRVVSTKVMGIPTGSIEVGLEASNLQPVRLKEFQIIASALDRPINYTDQVNGQVLQAGSSIELDGVDIDIDFGELVGRRIRYTFFATIIGETLDGRNTCNGNSFLECSVGLNLEQTFPTEAPTPNPTTTPYPTGDPESTACEIQSEVRCTVLSPQIDGIFCDRLSAPVDNTCLPDHRLYVAFLEYDGSLGDSIFVVPTCGDKNEFTARTIATGEIYELNTRASDFCDEVDFDIYTSDPLISDGERLGSSTVAIPCPGPWTLGNEIAPGLTLKAFASTPDFGVTVALNLLEAEIQIDYTGVNTGNTPLTVDGGNFTGFDNVVSLTTPVTIPQRSTEVLSSETQTIQLFGQGGERLNFSMDIIGSSANEFAIPCEASTSYNIDL